MKRMRFTLTLLVLLTPVTTACLTETVTSANDIQTSEVEGLPWLTWTGGPVSDVAVYTQDQADEFDDEHQLEQLAEPYWKISCHENDPEIFIRCIESPVQFGLAPQGVEASGALRNEIPAGRYVWKMRGRYESGASWGSNIIPFEVVELVAVRDSLASEEVALIEFLRDLIAAGATAE